MSFLTGLFLVWYLTLNFLLFIEGFVDSEFPILYPKLIIKRKHLLFPGYVLGFKLGKFLDKEI